MDPADPTRFVLVGASHPGNVGAAARAIRVMGFGRLVLVAPRRVDLHREPDAIAMASGATDVLDAVQVVPRFDDALEGITHLVATAMTPRDFGPPTFAPRALLPRFAREAGAVGFVFGSERFGLANEVVWRCHACVSIPTDPDYGSLNLAQAVQIVAYEWRQALGGYAVVARTKPPRLADAGAVQGALDHWRSVLVDAGFLDPAAPKKLMPRLAQLVNRAQPTREEVDILRGIARALAPRRPDGPGDGG